MLHCNTQYWMCLKEKQSTDKCDPSTWNHKPVIWRTREAETGMIRLRGKKNIRQKKTGAQGSLKFVGDSCSLSHIICMRSDHKIHNDTHFKSFYWKRVGKGKECTGLSERNMVNVWWAYPLLKIVQCMHIGAYTAMPCMCINYVAAPFKHILHRAEGPWLTRQFACVFMSNMWPWDFGSVHLWGA